MNFNDSEIVLSILREAGGYERTLHVDDADVVLLMTCAIRENAETKIWNRLDSLRALERQRRRGLLVAVLGCMAERLKTELLEKKQIVDVVCGPDAYRDLPRLLQHAEAGQAGVNVMLSMDETYADVAPVRLDPSLRTAFISVMRGCNNMCAFCIVPFTRGRERSRPIESIVDEAKRLADSGVREITLLGQNVNSYCDESQAVSYRAHEMSAGFTTLCKPKVGGRPFVELLDRVSAAVPNVRIRFTSPHPKDFPSVLLQLMGERPNICKQIHLPAQSGSSSVLERMRRGYTRATYLSLVDEIRQKVANVSLSSDFIVGFCGETEEEFQETLSLVRSVGYDMAYMFAYSMREKTMAHRRYIDDVLEDVKQRRLRELIDLFYAGLKERMLQSISSTVTLMIEGKSKRSDNQLAGRGDNNRTYVLPDEPVDCPGEARCRKPGIGDYVLAQVCHVSGTTPITKPLRIMQSLAECRQTH